MSAGSRLHWLKCIDTILRSGASTRKFYKVLWKFIGMHLYEDNYLKLALATGVAHPRAVFFP